MEGKIELPLAKRCCIGEGPIWNEKEGTLYFTNGMGGNEICRYAPADGSLTLQPVKVGCAAFAFDIENRLIVSRADGVFYLDGEETRSLVCDGTEIRFANDMKVGPDGRLYVGTQSRKRLGLSEDVDGRLYRVDPDGTAKVLLDGMRLSNGMEWSMDERTFYHTDSDTSLIREYRFDALRGELEATGRRVLVPDVDGFTVDRENRILAACWGHGRIAVVDTEKLEIADEIPLPCRIPASCGFFGEKMDRLAVTTATYGTDAERDPEAGRLCVVKNAGRGRLPWRFGGTD